MRALYKTLLVIGIILLVAIAVAFAPMLVAIAYASKGNRKVIVPGARALWLMALTGLYRELRRDPSEPRGPWHGCENCGGPIPNASRARYCSRECARQTKLRVSAANAGEVPF